MRHYTLEEWQRLASRRSGHRVDLTGQRRGRLIALKPVGVDAYRNVIWLCSCDCGGAARVRAFEFTKGKGRSCGCLRVEANKARGPLQRHHFRGASA